MTPEQLHGLLTDPTRAAVLPAEERACVLVQLAALLAALGAGVPTARAVPTDSGRLLTVRQLAERLQQSEDYVYRHARDWPFTTRNGRSLRFSEAGLERWLASRRR